MATTAGKCSSSSIRLATASGQLAWLCVFGTRRCEDTCLSRHK